MKTGTVFTDSSENHRFNRRVKENFSILRVSEGEFQLYTKINVAKMAENMSLEETLDRITYWKRRELIIRNTGSTEFRPWIYTKADEYRQHLGN